MPRTMPLKVHGFFLWAALALPAAAATPLDKEPVPKALARTPKETGQGSSLPAFLGFFGPAALIEKTGFRSVPGRWISFDLAPGASMRLQEVAGAPQGSRWIELLAETGGATSNGVRLLARGPADGNVTRLIASMPGFPALEFPLDSGALSLDDEDASVPSGPIDTAAFAFGKPRLAGRESLTVPLGTFACDHWVVELPGRKERMEVWTTKDERVPFTGAVKMVSPTGTALARKVGTDASARIAVPPRQR